MQMRTRTEMPMGCDYLIHAPWILGSMPDKGPVYVALLLLVYPCPMK